MTPDEAATEFTRTVLHSAAQCIPQRECRAPSSHPWLDRTCMDLVRKKVAGVGTPEFQIAQIACREGLEGTRAAY